MKRILSFVLIVVFALSVISCSEQKSEPSAVGHFVYEGEGFGGDFTVTVNEDGSFSYYVGMLSSYIGLGSWSLDGDVLRLKDRENGNLKFENYFRVTKDGLEFIEDGSTNFMYLTVKDGARFLREEQPKLDGKA